MDYRILFAAVFLTYTFVGVICEECPELYQRYHENHSYCKPENKACNRVRSGLTKKEREQVLSEHNKYREKIAYQQDGNNGLPGAADMLFMEWDNELASVAQKHADQCIYDHDDNNQRRVQNFGVGQNMAKTGPASTKGTPDWARVIGSFYGEIKDFSSDQICGPRVLEATGHFTQVVWSETYRVGCGYTQYKEGSSYIEIYVCNYGPGGNDGNTCVYEEGSACNNCPENTQCDSSSGLCRRLNKDEGVHKPDEKSYFFNCNFNDEDDCMMSTTGDGEWLIYSSLDGNYLEVVLQPGQNATITFANEFTPPEEPNNPSAPMCIRIKFRKGPNSAKNPQNHVAKYVFNAHITDTQDFWLEYDFPNQEPKYRQQFMPMNSVLNWRYPTQFKISFAVPKGGTPQFFNLASVAANVNRC